MAGQGGRLDHRPHDGRDPRNHHLFRAQAQLSGPDAWPERDFRSPGRVQRTRSGSAWRPAPTTSCRPPCWTRRLSTLEPPGPDENTLAVDIGRRPAEVAAEIIRRLDLLPQEGSSSLGSTHPGTSSAPALSDLWRPDQAPTAVDAPGRSSGSTVPNAVPAAARSAAGAELRARAEPGVPGCCDRLLQHHTGRQGRRCRRRGYVARTPGWPE